MKTIVIVGAGIVGLTSAYALHQRGFKVIVLDQASGSGLSTSYANGCQLSYAYVQPLATPSVLRHLPSYLIDQSGPLRVGLTADISRWKWCAQFLRNCTPEQVKRTTAALLELARISRSEFERWYHTYQPDCSFGNNGKLVLYRTARSFKAAIVQAKQQIQLGCEQQILNATECITLEPSLATTSVKYLGGIWTPSECVADCHAVCQALEQLLKNEGVIFHYNTAVNKIEPLTSNSVRLITTAQIFEATACVLATAAYTNVLLKPLGTKLPIEPLKGYSISLPADTLHCAPRCSITDADQKIVYAPVGNILRVAGFAELLGYQTKLDSRRVQQLVEATKKIFSVKGNPEDLRPWCGLRPTTPDSQPIVKQLGHLPVYLNVGHGALGFTLAFGTSIKLAQLMTDSNDLSNRT